MRGVVLTGHGGPEKLVYREDLPQPNPYPGEVLVRVTASAVNNTDINTRIGWYSKGDNDAADAAWTGTPLSFPLIQGADACGVIEAVGEGVAQTRIGERVLIEPSLHEARGQMLQDLWYFGSECDGGFAEFATVASRHAHAIDSRYSDAELATFPCSYSTAENLLVRSGASAEDIAIVTGASGGVGSAAVQLLKARGAYVVAVSQPKKADALRELGADNVVPRDVDLAATFGQNHFTLAIDLVGGPGFPALLDLLQPGGRYAASGAVAGAEVALDLRTLYLKDLRLFGCTRLGDGVFAGLIRRIEREEIRPLLSRSFALQDLALAQEAFLTHDHIGKIGVSI